MAVNFSDLILLPNYNVWARSVTITPLVSQPGQPAYVARAIYSTVSTDVMAEDGSVVSDQRTIADIREVEFTTLPRQGDLVDIPDEDTSDGTIPSAGTFEISSASSNGGGETTLTLKRYGASAP